MNSQIKEIEPPWVYAPGFAPADSFWRQAGETWFVYIWLPYWESLTEQERDIYLKKWEAPAVWLQYSYHINPNFKKFIDELDLD